MPKKTKVRYDNVLTFEKLYEAFYRARKGKVLKREIVKFEQNLESNLIDIYDDLYNLTYKVAPYRSFTIYEPKARLIKTLPLKDRVIHQWYVEEFLKKYMIPRFINDTYACIPNRGTHNSYKRILKYMREMRKIYGSYYIIKMDIRKYFFNIDRQVLYNILEKRFKDKKFLTLTKIIIGDFDDKGIPIGNYTSQYYANIYLTELDYFVKISLGIKHYCRYMDDFVILVESKEKAKEIFDKINSFVNEKLLLELNSKSRYYPSKFGTDFCGFIIHEDCVLLRKRNKKTFNKKIKIWNYLYKNNCFDKESFERSLASFKGSLGHADCYKYMRKCYSKIHKLLIYK